MLTHIKKKIGTPSNKFFFLTLQSLLKLLNHSEMLADHELASPFLLLLLFLLSLSFFLSFFFFSAFLPFLHFCSFWSLCYSLPFADDEDKLFIFSIMVFHKSVNAWLSKSKVSTLSSFTCTSWLVVNHLLGPWISIYYLIIFLGGFN